MHEQQSVDIRLVGKGQTQSVIKCPLESIDNVEQLIFYLLDKEKVGPLYRSLFGLRLDLKPPIWLAPDTKTSELLNLCRQNPTKKLDLLMRFRPFDLTKLLFLDKAAFELIFYQIRHDFMYNRFNDDHKDLVLINGYVLGLIIAEMKMYALEHHIPLKDIFKHVRLKKFIPRSGASWQRSIPFIIKSKINLELADRELGDSDLWQIKYGFMESFFLNVSQNYGSETYKVNCSNDVEDIRFSKIRIRYHQANDDSRCIIEGLRESDCSKGLGWTELADIDTICYGTLRDNVAEINRSNGRPIRIEFSNPWYARSFISAVSQYYRLMRRWNLILCREVPSPRLEYLYQMKCHGPIGFESSRKKLDSVKKSGAFLVRESMDECNKFMIETNIDFCSTRLRITIHVEFVPERKVFIKTSHDTNRDIVVSVILNYSEYKDLKSLINDIQIRIEGDHAGKEPAMQLKHCIAPSEYDNCPSTLLSLSNKKLEQLDKSSEIVESLDGYPKFIPTSVLKFNDRPIKIHGHFMVVRHAILGDKKNILVKELILSKRSISPDEGISQDTATSFEELYTSQLTNWAFINSCFFAETLGLDLGKKKSLYQEYFDLGSLDNLLVKNSLTDLKKLSIGCQLSMALLFLLEKRIIHGKIRCHNVFIKSFDPIQVKITDPLGTIDPTLDQAFIPPAYLNTKINLNLHEYDHSVDIWALGTTLWQVYSDGIRPPPLTYGNTLVQPVDCPDDVWKIIETCWLKAPTPQSIYRDLNDLLVWKDDERRRDELVQISHSFNEIPMSQFSKSSYITCPSSGSNSNTAIGDSSTVGLLSSTHYHKPNGTSGPNVSIVMAASTTVQANILKQKSSNSLKLKSPVTKFLTGFKSIRRKAKLSQIENQLDTDLSNCHTLSSRSSLSSDSEATRSSLVVGHEQNLIISSDKLELRGEIGRGSCGVVYRGTMKGDQGKDNQIVAIKCLNGKITNSSNTEDLKREFEILKCLDHKNIVKTFGFVNEENVMLVTEYFPIGSLLAYIKNSHYGSVSSLPLMKYALDIADGMKYLESKRIVHRDLALRNILLKDLDEAKICDFGLAQMIGPNDDKYKLKTERPLPIRWYAPEVLATWIFDHKTDVWSYGIVLWEMYSGGCNPQYSKTYADLTETLKHERLLKPIGCPDSIYELMLSCWAYHPDERPTFSQINERVLSFSKTNSPYDVI